MYVLNQIRTPEKFTGNEMLRFEKMSICVIDLYVFILVLSLYFI